MNLSKYQRSIIIRIIGSRITDIDEKANIDYQLGKIATEANRLVLELNQQNLEMTSRLETAMGKANNRFANVAYLNNEEFLRYNKDPVILNKVRASNMISIFP